MRLFTMLLPTNALLSCHALITMSKPESHLNLLAHLRSSEAVLPAIAVVATLANVGEAAIGAVLPLGSVNPITTLELATASVDEPGVEDLDRVAALTAA